ncbi:MAG: putative Antiactivator of flagellar biosynthesis FleN [Noviherbaspirillum sp.]|nr:putative Antiactivator of flagellar biosynthesis FleN [Noviherbaspirillum sp.]
MANFHFDQAEGLRRMLAGPKPRGFTFLSTVSDADKSAMLVNLCASLAQERSDAVLLDARGAKRGIAGELLESGASTLLDLAWRTCRVDDVVTRMPQGFGMAALLPAGVPLSSLGLEAISGLSEAFEQLATHADIVLVDAEPGEQGAFRIPALSAGEIVVQVSTSAESITDAYSLIKRLSGELGQRPFSVLVTGATEKEAQVVFRNMAAAASRYLAVKLNSLGSVPADEHLARAARLGRAVVDAFPMAGASVAFRRLAGRFAAGESRGMAPGPGR